MSPYPYQPLNLPQEIRVLTLMPGRGELICSLTHSNIESEEPYDALSYCWSKSVAHPLDLDDIVSIESEPDAGPEGEYRKVRVGDLLHDPETEYIYIKYGGVLPEGKILCDGVEMTVGGELFRALRMQRHETEPLRIWVDAICINQDDIQERTEHVKTMRSVYKNASLVRIWLGEAIGLENNIFRTLDDIGDILNDLHLKLKEAESRAEAQKLLMSHPKWYGVEWFALAQLLDRAWFERVWVIQEVANAKEAVIQSGRYVIPWGAIAQILNLLASFRMGDHIPHTEAVRRASAISDMRNSVLSGELIPEGRFLRVLENLRSFKSTLPCDKIYGILGILDPGISIDVDYSKSAEQLFTDIAVRFLQEGRMDMLYSCSEPQHPTSLDLPSWVPDWTRPRWTAPFHQRGLDYNVTGDAEPHLIIDAPAGLIRLRGRLLDTVRIIDDKAEIPVTRFDPSDYTAYDSAEEPKAKTKEKLRREQSKMRDAIENMVRLAWPTPEAFSWDKYENLWRASVCNRLTNNKAPDDHYGMAWENWMRWLYWLTVDEDKKNDEPYFMQILPLTLEDELKRKLSLASMPVCLTEFASAQKSWCYNRRFFISDSERYGWAVDGTQPGDRIAVLYGCRFPFLLRDAGDGSYKIVGDCYIHGLMDGEALGDDFEERELIIS